MFGDVTVSEEVYVSDKLKTKQEIKRMVRRAC